MLLNTQTLGHRTAFLWVSSCKDVFNSVANHVCRNEEAQCLNTENKDFDVLLSKTQNFTRRDEI